MKSFLFFLHFFFYLGKQKTWAKKTKQIWTNIDIEKNKIKSLESAAGWSLHWTGLGREKKTSRSRCLAPSFLMVQLENWNVFKMAEFARFTGHGLEERGNEEGWFWKLRSTPSKFSQTDSQWLCEQNKSSLLLPLEGELWLQVASEKTAFESWLSM